MMCIAVEPAVNVHLDPAVSRLFIITIIVIIIIIIVLDQELISYRYSSCSA